MESTTQKNELSDPAITRIARQAGVKSIAEPCFNTVRKIIDSKLDEVVRYSLAANSMHNTRTLMPDHVHDAFDLMRLNVAKSTDLGTSSLTMKN